MPDSNRSNREGGVNLVPIAGSVFVNNTSYSGADIKVVINTYGKSKPSRKIIQETEDEMSYNEALLASQEAERDRLLVALDGYKLGTPEGSRASSSIIKLGNQIIRLRELLPELQEKVKRLRAGLPELSTKVLAECQTLSLSTMRDKKAVRACGSVYPKGFTRGPREIAGSLIFTVFDEHVLYQFLEAHASDFDAYAGITSAVMDQLPPVDIILSFSNEYGRTSRMTIYGVEFVADGQTMSIEDIITEQVVSFVARDFDPMRFVKQRKLDQNSMLTSQWQPKSASSLLLEDDYLDVKERLSPFERYRRRRNPF